MQAFKENDATEAKVRAVFHDVFSAVGAQKDAFYNGAYTAYALGDVLAATGEPIAGVIPLSIFRTSFPMIHQVYTRPGTFDFYLELFKKVWGDDADIQFTVPGPGQLQIDIVALSAARYQAVARIIEDNEYVRYNLQTQDGENLIFLGTAGLQTEREAENLVRELHPEGVWVTINLSIS